MSKYIYIYIKRGKATLTCAYNKTKSNKILIIKITKYMLQK